MQFLRIRPRLVRIVKAGDGGQEVEVKVVEADGGGQEVEVVEAGDGGQEVEVRVVEAGPVRQQPPLRYLQLLYY